VVEQAEVSGPGVIVLEIEAQGAEAESLLKHLPIGHQSKEAAGHWRKRDGATVNQFVRRGVVGG
jgi:hypothetical protein